METFAGRRQRLVEARCRCVAPFNQVRCAVAWPKAYAVALLVETRSNAPPAEGVDAREQDGGAPDAAHRSASAASPRAQLRYHVRPGWSHTATRAARTARGGARFSTEARRQIKVDAAVARQEPRGGAPSDARDRSRGGRPARRWRELWRGPSLVLQGTAGGLEPATATACLHAWLLAACSLQKPANSHTPANVQAWRLRRRSRGSPRQA